MLTTPHARRNADVMKKALEAAKAEAAEHGGADAMDVDEVPAKEDKKEKKKVRQTARSVLDDPPRSRHWR